MTNREIIVDFISLSENEWREKYCNGFIVKPLQIEDTAKLQVLHELISEDVIAQEHFDRVWKLMNGFDPKNDTFDAQLKIVAWLADQGYGKAQCNLVKLYGWMDDSENQKNPHEWTEYVQYHSKEKKMKF